jgi:hypothetical protein
LKQDCSAAMSERPIRAFKIIRKPILHHGRSAALISDT